jgi:hypothetical protein
VSKEFLMNRYKPFARSIGISTLIALSAIPVTVYAGDANNRAIAAIAQARGKIQSGDKVGVSGEVPVLQSQARAALADAEALLSKGKKEGAIAAAQHAGELADRAIMTAERQKATAELNGRLDTQATAAAAEQSAAVANARADSAEQAATVATAQAEALRNVPLPAPTVTTVATVATVEKAVVRTPARVQRKRHRAIRKPAATPAPAVSTTTTVTTHQR